LHRFGGVEIGWVERRADPADNRVKRVYVCDAAAPVFMLMAEEGQRVFKTWMSGVAPAAEAEMLAGLRRIRANAEPRRREAGISPRSPLSWG
jgi:DNA-binding MarR family transcriptional regulator